MPHATGVHDIKSILLIIWIGKLPAAGLAFVDVQSNQPSLRSRLSQLVHVAICQSIDSTIYGQNH